MAANPAFAVTPRLNSVNISTANTARDGTGTITPLVSGVAAGTRIVEIVCKARDTTTTGQVRLFLHNGSSFFLFDEINIAAVATPGSGTQTTRTRNLYDNLVLPSSSWSLHVSTHNAESIDVTAFGADL